MNEDISTNAEYFQHEWVDQTTLHPLGLLMVLLCGIATLAVPRRYAVWPMIVMACFVAPAQRIVVMTLDFNLLRVMVLFGWARLLLRSETRGFTLRPIDWAVILWAASGLTAYTLLHGTTAAFTFKAGVVFDALGMYLLFRGIVRNWDDASRAISGFAWISVPVALMFAVEWTTGRNAFAFFGGVPELTVIRQGRLRCQGAFSHPITAGCFWASLLPVFAAGWWAGGTVRLRAIVGVIASAFIVVCCGSSTPVFGIVAALIGGCMFSLRRYMRQVRWGILAGLVGLHLIMQAPVWHLISRVSAVGGSTSYHRFVLIDQAIRRFGEWWLLGTAWTGHWGWDTWDVTNQYVLEAVQGGLVTLVLFVAIIALAFRSVGRLWRAAGRDKGKAALAWALGVSLFVHCMSFLGTSYFGQIIVVWYLLLAMIASTNAATQTARLSIQTARRRHPLVGAGSRPLGTRPGVVSR